MPAIKFDWTFNIGNVLTVFLFIASMVGGYVALKTQVTIIDERTHYLQESVQEIKENQINNRNELRTDIFNLRADVLSNEDRRSRDAYRAQQQESRAPGRQYKLYPEPAPKSSDITTKAVP